MWVFAIGFLAQAFFSARVIIQWFMSERAKEIVSPTAYWVFSIIGSYLLFIYGWLREDFAIILGQTLSYYIYLWNLDVKGHWKGLSNIVKCLLVGIPLAAFVAILTKADDFLLSFLLNSDVPLGLLIFGSLGQMIFSLRFIYQWICSRRTRQSLLSVGFWRLSLLGSGMIIIYGILRHDPVLILGQSVGFVAYMRNIMIGRKNLKVNNEEVK